MTAESTDEKSGKSDSPSESIVTVSMEPDDNHEDNAAEAQDFFKENYSSELAQVEAFLDENPDFFKDYLIRKLKITYMSSKNLKNEAFWTHIRQKFNAMY